MHFTTCSMYSVTVIFNSKLFPNPVLLILSEVSDPIMYCSKFILSKVSDPMVEVVE